VNREVAKLIRELAERASVSVIVTVIASPLKQDDEKWFTEYTETTLEDAFYSATTALSGERRKYSQLYFLGTCPQPTNSQGSTPPTPSSELD